MIGYEIFVRSFADSNEDGIGDFIALQIVSITSKNRCRCDWLTPHFKSPSYHGYDIIDYFDTNSSFGTVDDFKSIDTLHRWHKAGHRFTLNHVSDRHPWFSGTRGEKLMKIIFVGAATLQLEGKRHWDEEFIWHERMGRRTTEFLVFRQI